MASLALGLLGGFFGGPVGFMIGSMLGNLLFPNKEKPAQMMNLHLQNSEYGQMIPILYGTIRVAGNVIWQTDLMPHASSQGKGGPSAPTTYTYSASFAIYLCEGPIGSVTKVWADGTLIWAADGSVSGAVFPFTLYTGTLTQGVDPTMETALGVGFVPAYRGRAYVVANDLDLTAYGNRIPVFNFEVNQIGTVGDLHVVATNPTSVATPPGDGVRPILYHWDGVNNIQSGALQASDTPSEVPGGQQNFAQPPALTAISPPTALQGTYPAWLQGTTPQYQSIGNYVYSDGSSTSLRMWNLGQPINFYASQGFNPSIVTGDVTIQLASDGASYNAFSPDFLIMAGIPGDYFLMGACLSGDNKTLYVFMAISQAHATAGIVDSWWKIVDGLNTDAGAVAPGLLSQRFVGSGVSSSSSTVMSAEPDSGYFWLYNYGDATVHVYYIPGVSGEFQDAGLGTLTLGAAMPSSDFPTILAYQDGYAGLIRGTQIWQLSRLSATTAAITLASIVTDLSLRAGLQLSDINVTALTPTVDGYIITQQQTVRDNITPLQSAWFFDAVESSGVIKYVLRGSPPILTIPDSDLAAQIRGDTPPALVTIERVQEVDLPQLLSCQYINAANDYQTGTQLAQRQTVESQLQQSIQLSVSLSDAKAKSVVNTLLYNAWIERMKFTFSTSRKYEYLEPTDCVIVHGFEMRIMSKSDVANNIITFEAVAQFYGVWVNQAPIAAPPIGFTPTTPVAGQASNLILLDTPLVLDADDADGLYVGMAGAVSATWTGASLFQSLDGGTTFEVVDTTASPTTMGAVSQLPTAPYVGGNFFDETSIFYVTIGPGGGTLSSISMLAVLNGGNMCLCGPELLQFRNATLIGPLEYSLTGLLRGRRGTEWAINQHSFGEPFVMMPTTTDLAGTQQQLGQTLEYAAVTNGNTLIPAQAIPFVNTGKTVQCYSPVQLGGGTDASGNVTLNWIRRTRIGGAWNNNTDVPLSESSELFVVCITDSTYKVIARIFTPAVTTQVYTATQQVTDFGAQQSVIYFTVQQVGSYGLGVPAYGVAVGNGVTTSAVIAPVPPYNSTTPPPPSNVGCVNPFTLVTVPFANNVTIVNALQPNTDYILSFQTPVNSIAGLGSVSVGIYNGPATTIHAVLSTTQCGTAINAASQVDGLSGAILFTLAPNPAPTPTGVALQLLTTYYVMVTVDVTTNVLVTLNIP